MTDDLARELPLPPGLEDRTVDALKAAQLLATRPTVGLWRRLVAAAAIFIAGAVAGGLWQQSAVVVDQRPRFLLLLSGGPVTAPDGEAAVVEAYRAWLDTLRRGGRAVSGERLATQSVLVPSDSAIPAASDLAGYFVVTATGLDEALETARTSPHVARGGQVVVRPIDTP